jgi:hypothetical protein
MMKFIRREHIPADMRESIRSAFAAFGVTRREWRTLATLREGPASAAEVEAALRTRAGNRPPRPDRPIHPRPQRERRTVEQLLDGFVDRGWASVDRGSYALTAEGERIHSAVLANVQKFRMGVTAGHGRGRGHPLKRGLA